MFRWVWKNASKMSAQGQRDVFLAIKHAAQCPLRDDFMNSSPSCNGSRLLAVRNISEILEFSSTLESFQETQVKAFLWISWNDIEM